MAAEEISSLHLQSVKLKATEPDSDLLSGPLGLER